MTGNWGGPGFSIVATTSGTTVGYYCAWGQTGPLRIGTAGRASAEGRFFQYVWQPLWLEARESGDTLVVTSYVALDDSAHARTFRALRNAPSDVGAMQCPA
jgi:hypothetical protein